MIDPTITPSTLIQIYPSIRALVEAAENLFVSADDRGETYDEETGEDFGDWKLLREALEPFMERGY